MRKFSKVLVANRGEIAVRIIRAARARGYRTVAVYSDADAQAPHVALADEAVHVGPSPVQQSYLDVDRLLAVADATGADAVHPGYGFLSENAGFAERCARHGLTFIGPTAEVIALMGDKAVARRRMAEAGVPCVPGYDGADQSEQVLLEQGARIGCPLMVKAAAGGGGRGMRLVHDLAELPHALATARAEAESAFGSGDLILERALMRPRHVEFQVFADAHGGVVHLGERDCSIQRRHQKVIEEAPCPVMTPELREQMGSAAVAAARAVGYLGAGTVEFLLASDGEFYFLEMNTRIQVEHPVTEAITGLDLVGLQFRVAEGEPLGFAQEDVGIRGHAIEARLYAEDATEGFLPATGRIDLWRCPSGEGVRCDDGIETGTVVSPYYDPMLAKIIARGETRELARARLVEALRGTSIFGPRTNRSFLIECLERETFRQGGATTAFIAEEFAAGQLAAPRPSEAESAIGAVLLYRYRRDQSARLSLGIPQELLEWSSAGALSTTFAIAGHALVVSPKQPGDYRVGVDGRCDFEIEVVNQSANEAQVQVDGIERKFQYLCQDAGKLRLSVQGRDIDLEDELVGALGAGKAGNASGQVLAPMHGLLLEIFVQAGDQVAAGDRLAVLEAMKMQHDITAPGAGRVEEVFCTASTQVGLDAPLFMLELKADEK